MPIPALSYQLADVGSRGHNLYVPIPYQKSCKVVAEEGLGCVLPHSCTRHFRPAHRCRRSRSDLPPDDIAALEQVNAFFTTQLGQDPAGHRAGEQTIADTVVIPAGSSQQLEINGSRAITAIRGSVECGDRDDEMAALRELGLSISFDDHQQPSVWTPLGDFFGTAPGKNLYRSLPTGMTANGSYAYWYMPFAKRATMELKNDGSIDRTIRFEIVHAPLTRSFAGLGHFHAQWHRDLAPLPEDRFPDWRMLQTTGRGRFCGVMLHVWNPQGWLVG